MTSMAPSISQPTDTKTWFYVKDGAADGPHESDTLVQLYIRRAINDETLVWCAGEPSWRALGSYATLTEHVSIILSGPPARKRNRTDGEAELSCNFRKWLRDLDERGLMGALYKALKYYTRQVVQGHEAARDALMQGWMKRNPGCGNAEAALNTVLADCKYPEDLWAALGKPIAMGAVEELIEAAACVDPSFQKQVQAIWETGWLWKLLEKGAVDTLIPTLKAKPHILSMKNVKGYTLMHTAACNNNIAFVKRCWAERLLSPQLVNATDLAGNTSLHLAVIKGHEHMVELLLQCGALVNIQNRDNGFYSNGWAAETPASGSPRAFTRSLSVNGEPVGAGTTGTATLQTSSLPMLASISAVASLPVPANGAFASNHNTPVHLAAELGRACVLGELLRHGANLGIRNAAGKTPLQCALEAEDAESVELLLHSGADASGVLSSSNDEFTTPLHWAAARGNTRLVSMILRGRKSNVNLSNSHGWTPLQLAARRGEVQCVKLLLEAGANVHAKTQAGKTARDLAVANGRSDVVPVLEDYEQRIFEDGERQVKEEGGPP